MQSYHYHNSQPLRNQIDVNLSRGGIQHNVHDHNVPLNQHFGATSHRKSNPPSSPPAHTYPTPIYSHSNSMQQPRSSFHNHPSIFPHQIGSPSIVGDRTEYIERKVPRKVHREKKVKKTILVPTEVEREVPQDEVIEIKEKIIEVDPRREPPKVIYKEIIKQRKVKKTEYVDKKVPRISYKEKIVEVPEIQYVEVPVERIVEVPAPHSGSPYNKVQVPQYVERPYPVKVKVENPIDVHRRIPIPMEAVTHYTFELPHLKPQYKRKELAIYAPRFVEVPVPAELMDMESQKMAIHLREQIHLLASSEAPSLVEVEKIAKFAKEADFHSHIACTDYQKAIETAWRNKQLTIQNGMLQSNGHHGTPVLKEH